jgi:hypothetical protein
MLEEFDWLKLKAEVTYTEGDHLAVIRDDENALSWEPIFYRQSDAACCIKWRGRWQLAETIPGLERFERVSSKKYFDTATLETVDAVQ